MYVTGYSSGAGTGNDYATLKYDSGGSLLWAMRYDGPGNLGDNATSLALDSAGNVYVTGYSWGSGTGYDCATLKYDTDGNLLWEMRYNSLGATDDLAVDLAMDSWGNVYVAGRSYSTYTRADYLTLKYDSDGNLRWAMRYDGPGNGDGHTRDYDIARAIALDTASNVFVTGSSLGSGTSYDYATIKYIQTRTILPDSFSLFRGLLTGGGLSDLFLSDDLRLDVHAGLTLFLGESPLQVAVTGTSPVEVPSELRFKLEASANTPGLTQTIELFNYDTSSYEQVDLAVPGATDAIVEVVITTNPGRFVQVGTREMTAKMAYHQVGLTLLWPWSARLDQAVWTIVP